MIHISKFLDRVRAAEGRQQREVTMTLVEARDLHADITRLLMQLSELQTRPAENKEVTQIEIQGGSF